MSQIFIQPDFALKLNSFNVKPKEDTFSLQTLYKNNPHFSVSGARMKTIAKYVFPLNKYFFEIQISMNIFNTKHKNASVEDKPDSARFKFL